MKLRNRLRSIALVDQLGPGLVTGDDPSGIATYSPAGAQFGSGLLWTMVLTYPHKPFDLRADESNRTSIESRAVNVPGSPGSV